MFVNHVHVKNIIWPGQPKSIWNHNHIFTGKEVVVVHTQVCLDITYGGISTQHTDAAFTLPWLSLESGIKP